MDRWLYTPRYGRFEIRCKALDDPRSMVAFWMIGVEHTPSRSAEICVCEIFGTNVAADHVMVGVGVHPFGDTRIVDDFSVVKVPIDAREFHVYAAEWTAERISFAIDRAVVKVVEQSPSYPMQLMLSIYEFAGDASPAQELGAYPKQFVIDYVRGYRLPG